MRNDQNVAISNTIRIYFKCAQSNLKYRYICKYRIGDSYKYIIRNVILFINASKWYVPRPMLTYYYCDNKKFDVEGT